MSSSRPTTSSNDPPATNPQAAGDVGMAVAAPASIAARKIAGPPVTGVGVWCCLRGWVGRSSQPRRWATGCNNQSNP